MSRFEVSSKDSCALASWFCKGVVWKTNLSYLLKKKGMIMPGIMSEGSVARSESTCVGPPARRYVHRDGVGQRRSPTRSQQWPETAEYRRGAGCVARGARVALVK